MLPLAFARTSRRLCRRRQDRPETLLVADHKPQPLLHVGESPLPTQLLPPSARKEVIQPHLPVRLPCYDLAPITSIALTRSLRLHALGTPGFHGLTGGVCKVRERIHRIIADIRLLAIPASRSRVADCDLN